MGEGNPQGAGAPSALQQEVTRALTASEQYAAAGRVHLLPNIAHFARVNPGCRCVFFWPEELAGPVCFGQWNSSGVRSRRT